MARYPTFDEYARRGNYRDGIKKCDELLKRNANDPQLLSVKLQLLYAAGEDGAAVLDQLATIQPPISDPWDIVPVEQAVHESCKDTFPSPLTAGAAVAKLWDNAVKSAPNTNQKLDFLDVRFSRAISDNRLADAQQALIQLKAIQPKNRSFYMAHAAITQLLSSKKDDLQSRLALSLARKAVGERFDDDKKLDCRVPGQIFALQRSEQDLASIVGRPFAESKQVYDASRNLSAPTSHATNPLQSVDASESSPREWYTSEVVALKGQFQSLVNRSASTELLTKFVCNATRLLSIGLTSLDLSQSRGPTDACFLAVSGLVALFAATKQTAYLLHGAFIVDHLLQCNPHIHEARLVLVYLYMRLELGSLAISLFDSLRIKEIQHDTVGHSMLTHVSQVHPFGTKSIGKATFDPYEHTARALEVYNRHESKLAETEANVLRHGQTGMIFDLQELRNHLRTSLVRRLYFLEYRRIGRLTDKPAVKDSGVLGPRTTANWTTTCDDRDFNATFDFGLNVEKALYEQGYNASDSKSNILIRLLIDSVWSLADKQTLLVNDIDVLLQETEAALEASRSDASSTSTSNLVQQLIGDIALHLAKVLTKAADKAPISSAEVHTLIEKIQDLNIDLLVENPCSVTEHLTEHILFRDVLRIVVLACRYTTEMSSQPPDNLADLDALARQLIGKLARHAQERATNVKLSSIEEVLTAIPELQPSLALFGQDAVVKFCDKIAASAKDGWNGVAKIARLK